MINYDIRVKSISITNFRNFKNIKVNFGEDNYYPVVGKNGLGKTGLLEAINIALSDNSSKFNNIFETDFYCDEPIELEVEFTNYFFFKFADSTHERLIPCKKFKKIISRRKIKERNSLFSPPYDIKYEYSITDYAPTPADYKKIKDFVHENVARDLFVVRRFKVEADDTLKYLTESDRFSRDEDWENGRNPDIRYGIDKLPKVLFPKVFYFDKDRSRELLEQYNTTLSKVVTELNWRVKREILKLEPEKRDALKDKYHELHTAIKKIDKHKLELVDPVIAKVKSELGIKFMGDELDFYFMDLLNPYKGSLLGHMSIENQIVPVMKYGSGVSSLISLSFLMEFAKQAKECILILIDEPEIHLHPELSKKLKKILQDSEFQSIVSTHSHLFLDKEKHKNNICFDMDNEGTLHVKYCNQIELADVQFKLLGNSLDDLYIPQRILLVEGKYDKLVLSKCLTEMEIGDIALQILDCEGYSDIPNKADRYKEAISMIKAGTEKYKDFVKQEMSILVDGDVLTTTVSAWKSTYTLPDEMIKQLAEDEKGLEYIYPESLVKECVKETMLSDGTQLKEKNKGEIIKIIMTDDKKSEDYNQVTNRVSKSRLNTYVADNITKEIINSTECADLLEIIKWIATNNQRELM